MRRESEVWLVLLAGLVSTQLTLLIRGGVTAFAIMALLSWGGGGTLLWDCFQENNRPPPRLLHLLTGLSLLLWSLIVMSVAARLYDPLLLLVPVSGLLGLALVAGVKPTSPTTGQLAMMGMLLPAQVVINRFLPTHALALLTAHVSAFLLWLMGQPATAMGTSIVMPGKELVVDLSCTGVNMMSLSLATIVVMALLIPVLPWNWLLCLASASLLMAFTINSLRIALLGFMTDPIGTGWLETLQSFHFWHQGAGSQMFSVVTAGLTCMLLLAAIEFKWQKEKRQ